MAQHIAAYVCAVLVVGCVMFAIVAEWRDATERTSAPRRQPDLDYVRYAAEQAIRETERRAIRDILAVYHNERGYTDDVIEGTAVERL